MNHESQATAADISCIKCIFSFANFYKTYEYKRHVLYHSSMFLLRAHSEKHPMYRKSSDFFIHTKRIKKGTRFECALGRF